MPTIRKSLDDTRPLTAKQREQLRQVSDDQIDFSDTPEMTAEQLKRGQLKPTTRGGARPGAGRKPSGRLPVSLRLNPTLINSLRRQAKQEGKTISQVAEERLSASALINPPAPIPARRPRNSPAPPSVGDRS